MFEKDVSGINDIKKDVFRINKNDNKKMLLYLSIVASFTVLHGVLQHFYWLVFCFRPYQHNVYGNKINIACFLIKSCSVCTP